MKKRKQFSRLTALLLALLLLVSGCGGSEDTPPDASTDTPAADTSADTPETDLSADTPAEEDQEESMVGARLSRLGLMKGEMESVTDEDVSAIMGAVASMEKVYAVGADGTDPLIEDRDWSVYSSDLGREPLSKAELELYDRFDRVAMKYLTQSNLDGTLRGRSYKLPGVQYGDLGLSPEQAFDLLIWFEYNNPQYYFLNCSCAYSGDTILPVIYDFAVDGEKRAEITNELFAKLESWVEMVGSQASNTYQKEVCASNLICESVTYDNDALLPENGSRMSVCQSLYSVLILENTVCAGYSKAFCAIMSALDVDATAGLSPTHAWNVVRFDDGKYYCVDVCWNDTDSVPPYDNDYINVGDKDSKAGDNGRECHVYEDCYAGWIPELAAESYVPTEADEEENGDAAVELSAPKNFTVTEDADALRFTWDAVPGASRYVLSRFDNPAYDGIPIYSDDTDEPEYAYLKTQRFASQSLQPGTAYYFGLRAIQEDGGKKVYSDWAYLSTTTAEEETPAPTVTHLDPPTNIRRGYASESSAGIYWDTVDATEVFIYTDAGRTDLMQSLTIPSDSFLELVYLQEGDVFYLSIRAVREENGQTIYSDWVNFDYTHSANGTSENDDSKLPAPEGIRPLSLYIGSTTAMLAWDQVRGATGYEINIYEDEEHTGEPETKQISKGNTVSLSRLKEGTSYYLSIRAVKEEDGQTIYSDWVDFTYKHTGHS